MSVQREDQLIKQSETPITIDSLTRDLKNLGLTSGDVVLVHSSMHTLGWVCGGASGGYPGFRNGIRRIGDFGYADSQR